MLFPDRGAAGFTSGIGQGSKCVQRRIQQPAQPDALALARFTDAVHSIVPVAGSDQRQAMSTEGKALVECTGAVFKDSSYLIRDRRQKEAVVFTRSERLAFQERYHRI